MANYEPGALIELASRCLCRAGAHERMARAAGEALVAAEVRGIPSHGVSRVPQYCALLQSGRADGSAVPRIVSSRGAGCLVDNGGGLAFLSVRLASEEAIRRAAEHGVGLAGVTNGGHMGAVGVALEPVAAAGFVGLAATSSPAAIPAWGGARPLLGTNPIAIAFPRPGAPSIVIDLSLTAVARGRLMLAAERGEPIPEGWAFDSRGRPTTDARAGLTGSMAPIGGAKGAALALGIELLCGTLTGAAFGFENDSFFAERGNRPSIGQVFLAVDPGALAGRQVYEERIEALVAAILADEGVRLPGARRLAETERCMRGGVEIDEALERRLLELAGDCGDGPRGP